VPGLKDGGCGVKLLAAPWRRWRGIVAVGNDVKLTGPP
jgi:hypothetical protein